MATTTAASLTVEGPRSASSMLKPSSLSGCGSAVVESISPEAMQVTFAKNVKKKKWDEVTKMLRLASNQICDASLIDSRDGSGVTAAVEAGREAVSSPSMSKSLASLLEWRESHNGNTVCHYAAMDNQLPLLQLLMDLGADLRTTNFFNRSALEEARKKDGSEGAVNFLLEHVYTPVEQLFYGNDDYESMVRVFSKHPEALNDRIKSYNNMTWTALCVEEARLRELRWLAAHGADFTVVDDCGNTLLHLVPVPYTEVDDDSDDDDEDDSESNDEEEEPDSEEIDSAAESEGLRGGRDLDRSEKNASGSKSKKTSKSEAALEVKGSDSQAVVESKAVDVLEGQGDLTDAERGEEDAFEKAAEGLKPEEAKAAYKVLAFLLSLNQLDVNQRNNVGETPAHVIAEAGDANAELVFRALQLLQEHNADFNIRDDDGATVAMALAGSAGDGPWLSWCLQPLAEGGGGCDPNFGDNKGRKVEDHLVQANLEAFDSELDIDEEDAEEDEDSD